MKRKLLWKSISIVALVLICMLAITGIPNGLRWQAWKSSILSRIHLGLDLKGGTHLILQVHVNDAIRTEANTAIGRLQDRLTKAGITGSILQPHPKSQPRLIAVSGIPAASAGSFRSIAEDELGNDYTINESGPGSFDISLKHAAAEAIRQRALKQSIETISNRIDSLGVTQPTVQQHGLGHYEILVQLPGISDPARVKEVMQETGMLEFHLVEGGPYSSEGAALAQYGGVLPAGSEVVPGTSIGSSETGTQYYVLSTEAPVSGNDLRDAEPTTGTTGGMEVSFTLDEAGGKRMGKFTGAHVGQQMAVVLDGRVQEAAVIKSQINDQGVIQGEFTTQQASDLALVLRSGALPASISYLEEKVVGPSLGADSIRSGVKASILGFLLVAGFMLFYYKGAGINAVLALVLNLIILMAFMAISDSTLTLPGIAGIILTIGMAVDSNVLIFERIREEMRNGKADAAAVDVGFKQAFVTILDTHVTTVVSAICLFLFGTGAIKGFAVTLTAGLIANLFTAVFVSRVIFDYILTRRPRGAMATLSI